MVIMFSLHNSLIQFKLESTFLTLRKMSLVKGVHGFAILLQLLILTATVVGLKDGEAGGCIERERRALLAFKQSVVDDYGILSSWGSEEHKEDCCKWRGVHCSDATGHVTGLDLRPNPLDRDCYWIKVNCTSATGHLRGNLSSSLFELQHLIYLDLSWNYFSSHIPESIYSLNKLKHLDLSRNKFGGMISSQLGNLTCLEFLNLRSNSFDNIQNLEWLSQLPSLKHLDLSRNSFTTRLIPSQLRNLTSLEFLDLSDINYFDSVNSLEWLSQLSSLKVLNLSWINLGEADDWLHSVNKLPHLTDVVLHHCSLQDAVVSSIPMINTSSLVALNLGSNNLTASIFQWVFKFSHSLVDLRLYNNQLRGPIPEAFGYMTSLDGLDLAFNKFEGGIPKSLGNLCRLRDLWLDTNNLNGIFAEMISNLSAGCLISSLEGLSISYNQVTGPLPDVIASFSLMKHLNLPENKLSGNLTTSIGLMSNLEDLYMNSNNLSGVITEAHFLKLSKLRNLDLSSNHLNINISLDWDPPFQLEVLSLASCMLGSEFPRWIKTQRELSALYLFETGISGRIPEWTRDLSSDVRGFLDVNLGSNYLQGPLPLFPANVTSINLSNNSFSGSISSLCAITRRNLTFLDLSSNQLSGELPFCLHNWPNLVILDLANNNFSGKIPSSFGSLSSLESFSLRNNNLVGEIPWSFGNCTELQFVDLSYNRFSGAIPYWIGERLPKLTFLLLKSNYFRGGIALQLCQLTKVLLLDLSNNSLSGNIPRCIHRMTALTKMATSVEDHAYTSTVYADGISYSIFRYADTTSIIWKGTGHEFNNIKNLIVVDFSNNELTGSIPAQMWSLVGLVQLNLSRNRLTGGIPSNLGHMQNLESLDLSINNLSGQLPESMSQMHFLGTLNVSYNNFSGRIPSGTQMTTFNETSFAGNPALCGPPLTKPCLVDKKPKRESTNNEEDEDSMWIWFKPGLAIGMAAGFVGVLAFKLDHPWKNVVSLLFNKLKVWFTNFKDCLYFISSILGFLVKENAIKLRRKLKFHEPPSSVSPN